MGYAKNFEELDIFQKARELCKQVYSITKEGEFHKDSRFVQQIHASAGSVMDNIAEGFERDGNKELSSMTLVTTRQCSSKFGIVLAAPRVYQLLIYRERFMWGSP